MPPSPGRAEITERAALTLRSRRRLEAAPDRAGRKRSINLWNPVEASTLPLTGTAYLAKRCIVDSCTGPRSACPPSGRSGTAGGSSSDRRACGRNSVDERQRNTPTARAAVLSLLGVFLVLGAAYLALLLRAQQVGAWRASLPGGLCPWLVAGWLSSGGRGVAHRHGGRRLGAAGRPRGRHGNRNSRRRHVVLPRCCASRK